ncbi:MAG: hypothetical protein ACKO26_21695, partial [Planctomycetota bacterium]
GWVEAAGDSVFSILTGLKFVDPNAGSKNSISLHFIGHDYGAAVNSEAVERLAAYQVPVDQVTYLDPHDFDQGISPVDAGQKISLLGAPNGYGATAWNNVGFTDVYYQTLVAPFGRPIPGAYNRILGEIDGISAFSATSPHDATWSEFYLRTVVDASSTSGFALSRFGGSPDKRPDGNFLSSLQDHSRTPVAYLPGTPGTEGFNQVRQSPRWQPEGLISNGNFSGGYNKGTGIVPGWSHMGDAGQARPSKRSSRMGLLSSSLVEPAAMGGCTTGFTFPPTPLEFHCESGWTSQFLIPAIGQGCAFVLGIRHPEPFSKGP